MADTKFIDLPVIKRLYTTLRGIINSNQKNNEAVISDISAKADEALAKSTAVENSSKDFATKDQLEQHKNLASSTYATKEELRATIGGVTTFEFVIVEELPVTGISSIVYLKRNSATSGNNIYDEYLWVSGSNSYERIGSMDVDLSGYLTKSDASTTYATKSDLTTGLSGKASTGHTHSYAGSSTAGGVATSAAKLTQSAGTATKPVYFSNGIPVSCTYGLASDVPANAKFTDTTYSQANQNTLGLVRLYPSTGQNTDGTMTQKAISDAISSGSSNAATNDSDGNPINTTYLKKVTAESTYLSKTDASTTYLSKIDAGTTYLTKTGAATKATADSDGNKFQDTYLKKASADDMYLTKNSAASTYLAKTANAASASKLATARTIELSGSVSGSASFDGSSNVSIKTRVQYGTEAPETLEDGVLFCVIES